MQSSATPPPAQLTPTLHKATELCITCEVRGLCHKHQVRRVEGSCYHMECADCRPNKLRGGGNNYEAGQDTCAVVRQSSGLKCHNNAQREGGCRPIILLVCGFQGKRQIVNFHEELHKECTKRKYAWALACEECHKQTGFRPCKEDTIGLPVVLFKANGKEQSQVESSLQIYIVQLPYRKRTSVLSKQVNVIDREPNITRPLHSCLTTSTPTVRALL